MLDVRSSRGRTPPAQCPGATTDNEAVAPRLNELSTTEVDQIEQARLRAARGAKRRELLTEAVVSIGFLIAAAALLVLLPAPAGIPWTALWLAGICAVLVRIEFEVGEGCTHPVQLAVVPMLLMLPPGEIPLTVAAAHLVAGLPEVLLRRTPLQRTLLQIA